MLISFDSKKFWVASSYSEKDVVKAAGFRWDPKKKKWWTSDPVVAAKLAQYADESCRSVLENLKTETEGSLAASRATDFDGFIPCPYGLAYLPFQKAGIAYAMARTGTLIGDDMGLGKTIQAIGTINASPAVSSILVICPASLRINWKKELEKWLVRPLSIGIANGEFPATDIVIINYDILKKHHDALRARRWDLLVSDECHMLKNLAAQRTQEVIGHKTTKKEKEKGKEDISPLVAVRRIFMTGTPICNRPVELWPLVKSLDADGLGKNFFSFAQKYCGAKHGQFGWDFTGSSNLDDLQDRLRSVFMVRRLKSQVLTELPPKRRQVIELPANGAAQVIENERRAWALQEEALVQLRVNAELSKASDDPEVYKTAVKALREAAHVAFAEISKVRHDTAVAKISAVVEHLRDAIESSRKVVLFCHHKDVVAAILAEFPDAAVITGDTKMDDRQAAVDRFQSDPSCALFIGTIGAAGVGHTLTAASHVVFAELDWVPGLVTQAEDRCHRIGQINSVLVQHLVLEGSLDAKMANVLVDKQNVIDSALDKLHPRRAEIENAPVTPPVDCATHKISRKQIEKEAISLAPEQVVAVHNGLRMLAGSDLDFAMARNGVGFSKFDAVIGHSLADAERLTAKQAALGRQLIVKYRRQLPDGLVEIVKEVA